MRPHRLLCSVLATATIAAAGTFIALAPAAPALALDNGLARTPPMGFNNWNTTQCGAAFSEAMVKDVADSFVSLGLKDVGYQYVNIDDCWAEKTRDVSTGHPFGATGDRKTWRSTSLTVTPTAGANTVRATASTAHGGPNMDRLELTTQP